jgi:hypothetical protein
LELVAVISARSGVVKFSVLLHPFAGRRPRFTSSYQVSTLLYS